MGNFLDLKLPVSKIKCSCAQIILSCESYSYLFKKIKGSLIMVLTFSICMYCILLYSIRLSIYIYCTADVISIFDDSSCICICIVHCVCNITILWLAMLSSIVACLYADRAETVILDGLGPTPILRMFNPDMKLLDNCPIPWSCGLLPLRESTVSSLCLWISATSRALLMICSWVNPASSNICDLIWTRIFAGLFLLRRRCVLLYSCNSMLRVCVSMASVVTIK